MSSSKCLKILNKWAANTWSWHFFADVFFRLWNTSEREMECLAHREESEKGGGSRVNYLNTITVSNNLHPSLASSLSNHPIPTFGLAFPPDRPDTLSSQRGPSLHQLKTWAAFLTNFTLLLFVLLVLSSPACLSLQPPLVGGELALTVKPQEGWKGQTCQAECYLNSSEREPLDQLTARISGLESCQGIYWPMGWQT